MNGHTWNDQARLVIARLGEATYTTRQVQDALGGYRNTSQVLMALDRYGEIECVDRNGTGKRAPAIWRTVQLRAVRPVKVAPAAAAGKPSEPKELYPLSEQEQHERQCAMRLNSALDSITLRNREECHA